MSKSYKYDTLVKLQKLVDNNIISEEDKQIFESRQEIIVVNNINTFLYANSIKIEFVSIKQKTAHGSYKVYSKTKNPYVKINSNKVYLSDLEHSEDRCATFSTEGINGDLEWKSYNVGLITVFRY